MDDIIHLDRPARIFFAVFLGAILASMIVMYLRYMVFEHYEIFLTPEAQHYLEQIDRAGAASATP